MCEFDRGGPELEAEVAVVGAPHDRLGSGELHVGVEAFDQRAVAVARQRCAEFGLAERPVHLGVAAAGHVEREHRVGQFAHLGFERVVGRPRTECRGEPREASIADQVGQRSALPACDVDHHLPGDVVDLVTEAVAEAVEQRADDARLDLAALEHADLVQAVGGRLGRHGATIRPLSVWCCGGVGHGARARVRPTGR
jgi:hypothetical protein